LHARNDDDDDSFVDNACLLTKKTKNVHKQLNLDSIQILF